MNFDITSWCFLAFFGPSMIVSKLSSGCTAHPLFPLVALCWNRTNACKQGTSLFLSPGLLRVMLQRYCPFSYTLPIRILWAVHGLCGGQWKYGRRPPPRFPPILRPCCGSSARCKLADRRLPRTWKVRLPLAVRALHFYLDAPDQPSSR